VTLISDITVYFRQHISDRKMIYGYAAQRENFSCGMATLLPLQLFADFV